MKKCITLLSALTFMSFITMAYADSETEKGYLANILAELDHIQAEASKAEMQQDLKARPNIRFRYDKLRADINKMKSGIQEYFNLPSVQPRTIEPIQGDYLINSSKKS